MTILIGAFIVAAPALFAGTANAAPTAPVGPGTAITIDNEAACTLAVAGHDRANRLVGITAAHCGKVGSAIGLERNRSAGTVGRIAYRNEKLDYAVIAFDANKVRGVSNVGQGAVHGIGAFPAEGGQVCKAGRTTGPSCGDVMENNPRYVETLSYVCAAPGDSGGAVMAGGKLVGILNGGAMYRVPLTDVDVLVECITPAIPIHSPMVSTRATLIIDDLNSRNVVGSGFRVA